ncbi:hypothetical protein DL96DRAFT_1555989 [Flagelloscypha sp. PMI_526]|nr:hypothetical protein DL96DRAFT_1555989 [Flagelloscypha sp. PMI_526]
MHTYESNLYCGFDYVGPSKPNSEGGERVKGCQRPILYLLQEDMRRKRKQGASQIIFKSYTLWAPFESLNDPNTTDIELALSVKVIVDHSNIVMTCNGILCGVVYQQNYLPGSLDNASKVLVTMSLLIVTWNRIQYEGHFINELRMRVQQTGPLLPTLRYIVPEVLLGTLLILEGYKAGRAAG